MEQGTQIGGESIRAQVRDFILENFLFGVDDSALTDSASLLENGFVDSTGILELVGFVENHYDIHVENDEMMPENLDSISNISTYVVRKLAT
jgi:acyl carrier protein